MVRQGVVGLAVVDTAKDSRPSQRAPGDSHQSSRIPELDGLRGLAILLVVASHAFIVPADMGGPVGVTLFFVLSGYLITRLLLIEKDRFGRVSLKAFYGRRALRLFPALLIYLVGIAVLLAFSGLEAPIWNVTWPPAFYLANYAQIFDHSVFPHRHTWSLAVEEHFYLVWPILVGLGATKKIRTLATAVAVLLGWRIAVAGFDVLWAYQGTDTNAYALGVGCLLAVAKHEGLLPKLPRVTTIAGVVLLVVACFVPVNGGEDFLRTAIWLSPVAAGISVLTIWSVLDRPVPFLRARLLVWFGLVSYALYLWHAPLMVLPPWSRSISGRLLGIVMAVGLAAVSWRFVEQPTLSSRWRERLERSHLLRQDSSTEVVVDLDALHTDGAPYGQTAAAEQLVGA